jgi:hypothetical protein
MAYVTTSVDVEVYLEKFDDDDLVNEVRSRGYEVFNKNEVSNVKTSDTSHYDKSISDLYNTYMTCSPELFNRELKKFFREYLDVAFI